jgi:hypothetical protein
MALKFLEKKNSVRKILISISFPGYNEGFLSG